MAGSRGHMMASERRRAGYLRHRRHLTPRQSRRIRHKLRRWYGMSAEARRQWAERERGT